MSLAARPGAEGPASYWRATRQVEGPMRHLDGDTAVEVAIVGGGYTGLSAAHELADQGVSCAVLEANEIGWGASGRSAGFIVPRYKRGFAALAAQRGSEAALRLHGLVLEALLDLDEVVASYGLDPFVSRSGHLTVAHGQATRAGLEADALWLAREARDPSARFLDRGEVRDAVGSDAYSGGYLDPRGGSIRPLDYVCGFAKGLVARGVPIFTGCPVMSIDEEAAGVLLRTPGGAVRAERVVFATNAYTDLAAYPGDLARRIVPVSSSLLVTEPIPEALRRDVLRAGYPATDTKRLLNAFHILPDGRMLVAGRGDLTGRSEAASAYRPLERAIAKTFPALAGIGVAYRWTGKVALPLDDLPHIGAWSDRIVFSLGCIGRGVLITHLLGRHAARLALGQRPDTGPMSRAAFPVIPFHRFRHSGMRLMAGYYGLRDRLDARAA